MLIDVKVIHIYTAVIILINPSISFNHLNTVYLFIREGRGQENRRMAYLQIT